MVLWIVIFGGDLYYLTMSIFWYFLFCLGFLLGLLCSVLFLFDIPFFFGDFW